MEFYSCFQSEKIIRIDIKTKKIINNAFDYLLVVETLRSSIGERTKDYLFHHQFLEFIVHFTLLFRSC